MKIAIIGRTETLYKVVELLIENGYEIGVIITSKEAPEYKKTAKDFEKLAKKINAKFLYSPKFTQKEISFLKNFIKEDYIGISINYTGVIQQEVIDIFSYGILNAHGGNLPRYKGNACQAWAILNGEEKIGLCIHKMLGDELDSGDIIEREYLTVDLTTKIGEVLKWMDKRIPSMFLNAIKKLQKDKNYFLEKQNHKNSLRCYPRLPEDGRIDWSKSNIEILRLINASNKPYMGAFCVYKDKKLIVWDAEIYEDNENYCAVPGQVAKIEKNSIMVIVGKGKLKINTIEYDNFIGYPSKIINSIRKRLK